MKFDTAVLISSSVEPSPFPAPVSAFKSAKAFLASLNSSISVLAALISSSVTVIVSVLVVSVVLPLIVNLSICSAEVEESAKLMLICLVVSALSRV